MRIRFGREVCGDLAAAQQREWLLTNGLGGYASGTVAGLNTRAYHGLLVAALRPPGQRRLLLAKLDETATYDGGVYPLCTNRWTVGGALDPNGSVNIERFHVEGGVATWEFAFGDALLQKQVWMPPRANTAYVRYELVRGSRPLDLACLALVNDRDQHGRTRADGVQFELDGVPGGVRVRANPSDAPPTTFVLLADAGAARPGGDWYRGFDLAAERERGLSDSEDHFHAATFQATLRVGRRLTFLASAEPGAALDGDAALTARRLHDQAVLDGWRGARAPAASTAVPDWVEQLVLASDQFIVDRPDADHPDGKTIIAGYHWFGDWGRDTMISLPGLTLVTGRVEVAAQILRTFARFVSQGMLPNNLPDDGQAPSGAGYNTVDATLWFVEAIRAYVATTGRDDVLREIFPVLKDLVAWHQRGTRFGISVDPTDGLLRAGVPGVQLTWMDARVGDWVVTPRIGKPVEINALWYNALRSMGSFARRLSEAPGVYDALADAALTGFSRFWNASRGYCFDVLDGPEGNDPTLRPNQLFAVSLPESPLSPEQQVQVVDVCARYLHTSYGLRSLPSDAPAYRGHYGGDQAARDGAYHQGTVWAWLLGPFALAHLRVHQDPVAARALLEPIGDHLRAAGLGSVSEIFDGDAPFAPRGCIAQAWSVGEILRAWTSVEHGAFS
ncbi:MAG TPA: amylo-alpha-1,6-glucosidase [Chloroflexota bacterium]|nr:amylo-alpha-1,6-glucosidase [Chloroflexota bacterium]